MLTSCPSATVTDATYMHHIGTWAGYKMGDGGRDFFAERRAHEQERNGWTYDGIIAGGSHGERLAFEQRALLHLAAQKRPLVHKVFLDLECGIVQTHP
jgi:hypothetical protein